LALTGHLLAPSQRPEKLKVLRAQEDLFGIEAAAAVNGISDNRLGHLRIS
jgi:hypothetical protein